MAAHSGVITTVAGGGNGNIAGFSGDGGPATKATLNLQSTGVAVDGAGNVYLDDVGNFRVRRVDARTGIITTVAGNGNQGDGVGDGGPATSAAIEPIDIALDASDNLYISDNNVINFGSGSSVVRRVDARTGIITTVAGGGNPPDGLGDGGPATAAALNPGCLSFDPAGNLAICDFQSGRIRRVDHLSAIITTVAGGGSPPDGIGDGGPAISAAINSQGGLGFDAAGNMYVSDNGPNRFGTAGRIRRVDAGTGIITTVAGGDGIGDGGPATSAELFGARGVATRGTTTYIADGLFVRRVDAAGTIATVAGGANPSVGLGDHGPATSANVDAQAVTVDPTGNLFVSDAGHQLVRRVDSTGVITTVAGGGSPPDGLGDGGTATSAALNTPQAVAIVPPGNPRWPAGTMFIADCNFGPRRGLYSWGRVRRVNPAGIISTVAGNGAVVDPNGNGSSLFSGDGGPATQAGVGCVSDIVVDPAGNLLFADRGNSRVRRVDAGSGIITTVAGDGQFGLAGEGGPAVQASLNTPTGLALDRAGNLYIADAYERVVKVNPAGILTLVAGSGVIGLGGDGGPAVDAGLLQPQHLAVEASGNLLIADAGDARVREVRFGAGVAAAGCGQVITANTTLAHDIGPCSGAGLVVGADNITVNLNGHRIFGTGTALSGQYAGILLNRRTGVTVTGGQVDHFSAGVSIVGGTRNTISRLTVSDNVGSYDQLAYADGIVVLYSSQNKIVDNQALRNGIYDNIGVLGRLSDHNVIKGNTVADNVSTGANGVGQNVFLTAFAGDIFFPDRVASLLGNQIISNTVRNAYANGISNFSNTQAQILGNTVEGSGVGSSGDGVGIGLQAGLLGNHNSQDLVQGNVVVNNASCGIQTLGTFHNRIVANTVTGNGILGGCTDLEEDTIQVPPCVNLWLANTYTTATVPACTTIDGHQVNPTPAASPPSKTPPALHQLTPGRQSPLPGVDRPACGRCSRAGSTSG